MENLKNKISNIIFIFSIILLILYQFTTFYPGAEKNSYLFLCLLLTIPVVLSDKKIIKIIGLILLIISIIGVYGGYKRGVEYKEFLDNKNINKNL